jgi:hypothetical protein
MESELTAPSLVPGRNAGGDILPIKREVAEYRLQEIGCPKVAGKLLVTNKQGTEPRTAFQKRGGKRRLKQKIKETADCRWCAARVHELGCSREVIEEPQLLTA